LNLINCSALTCNLNHLKIKIRIVFPAYAAILFLLLTISHVWADETIDSSASAKTDVTFETGEASSDAENDAWEEEDNWDDDEWEEGDTIADPLEPLNRAFFHFNDKLYYWVLKPVTKGYSFIVPEDMQIVIRNFFDNLRAPGRAVNSLLQGQVKDSSAEVARFVLNSTVGVLGFGDFAKDVLDLPSTKEDTGQTLGFFGAGGGFYIMWPFLGPSNLRDSIGLVGDAYMHPFMLLDFDREVIIGMWVFEKVNKTALTMGDYELFTETALDPYTAIKDAYHQHRNGLIKE
jgi:phospholipid-binding lipoprotein MlaA